MNAGTEISYKEFLFLRAGYNSLFLNDNEGGLALGFGFTTQPLFSNLLLKFDYAYRDMARLENAQFFSVALEF